jgi:hypothetical protein
VRRPRHRHAAQAPKTVDQAEGEGADLDSRFRDAQHLVPAKVIDAPKGTAAQQCRVPLPAQYVQCEAGGPFGDVGRCECYLAGHSLNQHLVGSQELDCDGSLDGEIDVLG